MSPARMMIALVLVGASVLRPTPAFATPVEERIVEDPLGAEAHALNRALRDRLREIGFTGSVEATLPERLGRPINRKLATVGRLLWFDTVTGLNDDNSCGGCHSPTNGFGDTQSIAIGIENNNLVGPSRTGPRNQRRAPRPSPTPRRRAKSSR